ncbi:MAG: dehydrogenase/reductase oxidoreductase protein-like protein [Polaromonas sp.]|nr:dehydrogenase/reductase oxidoreductase protein-like protein [Polaromonas sp.]
MPSPNRPLALVTGASSGIGYQLAMCCAENGFDLIVAADQPLDDAAADLRALGAQVETVQTELATCQGVDKLVDAVRGRPVDALLANAGHGLGRAFLEQDFNELRHVIDTNITGTVYLLHRLTPGMCARGRGRILITGSIAGYMPGAYQAVYNGTKAFVDSFAQALRTEIKETGVTVSLLIPGPTDTEFFARADMLDTKVGTDEKAMSDPAEVAKAGFKAMMEGEADVVAGLKNKMQVAMSKVVPAQAASEMHRKMAQPGTAENV